MLKTIIFALLVSQGVFAADSLPGFGLVKISKMSAVNVDAAGNATLDLEYEYQPCSQVIEKYAVSEVTPLPNTTPVAGAKYFALSVLVKNTGVLCAGPTMKQAIRLQAPGPLPAGGAVFYPVQP